MRNSAPTKDRNGINNFRISPLYRRRTSKAGILVVLIVTGGFLEVLRRRHPVSLCLRPARPSRIAHMSYVGTLYRWLNLNSDRTFIVVMSIGLLALFCFKAFFTVFLTNYQLKLVNDIQTQLGQRLMTRYLGSPYEFFLSNNTATLIGTLTTSVVQLASGVILSSLPADGGTRILSGPFGIPCLVESCVFP